MMMNDVTVAVTPQQLLIFHNMENRVVLSVKPVE